MDVLTNWEDEPRYVYQEIPDPAPPMANEVKVAIGGFLAAFGASAAYDMAVLPSMAQFDSLILWRAVAIGFFVAGILYIVSVTFTAVAPALIPLLVKDEQKTQPQPKADLPTGQPKREPVQHTGPEPEPELPQWLQNVDDMVWGDRLHINGRIISRPEKFDKDWLYDVAEARWDGKLESISTPKLHDIGVSRFETNGGETPAAIVISILEAAGCIRSLGERQGYEWTEAGKTAFPSPTNR